MSPKSHAHLSARLMLLVDAALVGLAFIAGALLRDPLITLMQLDMPKLDVIERNWWMLVMSAVVMPFLLRKFGFYTRGLRKGLGVTLKQLFQSSIMMGGVIAISVIFLKLDPSSRLAMAVSFLLMIAFLLTRDRLWRRYRRRLARKPKFKELVLFAGSGEDLEEILTHVPSEVKDFWNIVDSFDFAKEDVEDLRGKLDEHSIQRVVFGVDHTEFATLSRAVEICETQGVEAWIHAGFIRTQLARPDFDTLGGKPMLVLRSTPELSWALFFKELMDRVGAFVIICGTLPLMIFAWIGIKITSPGHPAIFVQDRAGRFGRPFRMFKFRTMIPDAEAKLKDVKEDVGNQMDGPVFKLDHDPRVFKFGSFLRKTSIDELPQLFNVLFGDMSLVGPRPLPCYEVKEFSVAKHRRRLSVKPGITCTWQAGGRNSITSFEEWVDMDLDYIDTWSLWRDIAILLKTIPAVLLSRGAK